MDRDLACGPHGQWCAGVGVDDADAVARHRLAMRAPADRLRRHADIDGVRFRQAVAGLERCAAGGEALPLLRQLLGEGNAETGHRVDAQRAPVHRAGAGQAHQGAVHRRNAVPPAHAVALQRLRNAQRVEAVQQHCRGAGVNRQVHAHHHAGDVVQRRHGQQHIVAARSVAVGGGGGLEAGVFIGQHRALGQAGAARGVGHQGHVVHGDAHRCRCAASAHQGQKILAARRHGRGGGTQGL